MVRNVVPSTIIDKTTPPLNGPVEQKLNDIKSKLIDKFGKDDADMFYRHYDKLARRMLMSDAKLDVEVVVKAISDLEGQVDQLLDIFYGIGLDRLTVRKWLENVISKELDTKGRLLECPPNFAVTSWVKIGRMELYALVNANRQKMGFFERVLTGFPVREVTEQAFDVMFGDQNRRYERGIDDVSLAKFTDKMKNEVLVFAGSVSSDALEKTLELFATRRFFLIDKDMMSDRVKRTLYDIALNNVERKFPPKNDSIAGNKERREYLSNRLRLYYHDNSKDKLMINSLVRGDNYDDEKVDEKGDRTKIPFNYFEGEEDDILLIAVHRVLRERGKAGVNAVPDDKDVYYMAGLTALSGEHGLVRHLESQGGSEQDMYRVNIRDNPLVSKALISLIVRDYGTKKLKDRWTGRSYYTPDEEFVKNQIKWLKRPEDVDKRVSEIDRENPEIPVPPPDGVVIPASDDQLTNN